jgi:hypothetical protein
MSSYILLLIAYLSCAKENGCIISVSVNAHHTFVSRIRVTCSQLLLDRLESNSRQLCVLFAIPATWNAASSEHTSVTIAILFVGTI